MRVFGSLLALALVLPAFGATFGTVVTVQTGASDLVLDEPRNRLYLVDSTSNNIDIYQTNFNPPRATNPIRICHQPVAAAMSLDGNTLYVTCFQDSTIAILNLTNNSIKPVNLPASPQGIAVGGDGRVVITTIGTSQGRETMLVYDPVTGIVSDLFVAPPPPSNPQLPPPNGRIFGAYRSQLVATKDGQYIIGVNGNGNTRYVFVYEVVSATVLRSRAVSNLSDVISVSPDGTKFMAGSTLFDFQTLQVLAQENAANAPFTFPAGNSGNFNLQQNQGGSVFSPDGSVLYAAFNMAPVQNPPARANVTRLLLNDPDNLLIRLGIQLPENLSGKMVITRDGGTIYALSESGFVVLPISTINRFPIAAPQSRVTLLANDQCGVTASQQTSGIQVRNAGGGNRMTVTAQLLPTTGNTGGLGGFGGPGGGGPAGGIIIVLPPVIIGGGSGGGGGGFAAPGVMGNTRNTLTQTSPLIRTTRQPDGSTQVEFLYNPINARSLGTVTPHDFLIQSDEAINIPPNVRVFQNNRNAESKGTVIPVDIGVSNSEGLVDLLADNARQKLYIANSGLNRVEVFDMQTQTFQAPIKVGQLPHSLSFGTDGSTLYVTSTGGESISVVDLDKGVMTGRIQFPPLPFNAGFSLITPQVIASSQRGPQVIMSDGTLWRIVGDQAVPRLLNTAVFGNVRSIPAANPAVRTMASTPDGQYVILTTSSGFVYLYSAAVDDFVLGRQVFNTPITGFIGPVSAGPGGSFFLANATILNQSLTPIGAAPSFTIGGPTGGGGNPGFPGGGGVRPGTPTPTPSAPVDPTLPLIPGQIPGSTGLPTTTTTVTRPVSAVIAVGRSTFLRFSQPVLLNGNATPTDAGSIEMVNADNGNTMFTVQSLEGPLTTVTNNGRAAINGRTMAADAAGTTAYVLTTSGLTLVPLAPSSPQTAPRITNNGVVNYASRTPSLAPGGLVSIFGQNLAVDDSVDGAPLSNTMGGACVTLNDQPLPLMMTSSGQINGQIPPTLGAGRYQLVVRNIDRQVASQTMLATVSKYAPAVFVQDGTNQPLLYHADGSLVTVDNKAKRDEPLKLYATGMGVTKGGKVIAGQGAPSSPLAVTDKVQVFFGNPGYSQAGIIVDWSGLVPGLVGVYELDLRVPGNHLKGDALPIQVRIGGVNSVTTGPTAPLVAVE